MTDPRRAVRIRLALAVCAIVILGTIAKTVDTSFIRKAAVILCFVVLAALYFLPAGAPSAAVDSGDDDDDSDGRQSLPARLAWAVWMSVAAAACFGIGELAGALTPALQLPLRGVGVVFLIVAAYKLFFGRRNGNTDIDL